MAKKNAATQVRLAPDIRDRLDRMADRSGFKISELIRRAIESFLNDTESEGEIRVPISQSASSGSSGHYVLAEKPSSSASECTFDEGTASDLEKVRARVLGIVDGGSPRGKRVKKPLA